VTDHRDEPVTGEVFRDLRPLLFSIAYRMLASASDAEDAVQEGFIRYQHAVDSGTVIESPKAYRGLARERRG